MKKTRICELAGDTSTATCTGSAGMLRGLRTPKMERCLEMESQGASPDEVGKLFRSGFRVGLLEGNLDEGTIPCGASAGMVKKTRSAADIVRGIICEAEQVMGRAGR